MIAKKKALCALSLIIIFAVMLLSGCAGIPSALSIDSLISPVTTFFGNIFGGSPAIEGLISLDEAFDAVAAELEASITTGYEVAVYKIAASREGIGNFLADNLSDRLAARKKLIPLAREEALRYAETEHQFQMSGLVSDDSAVGIGHYLGAKVVITGDFLITADFSQLRVRAVDVGNSAILGASPIVLINNNDPILKNLMASFGIIPTSRVNENALAHLNRGKDLYMEDKLDAAIVEFGKALAIDKKLFEAYSYRGSSFYEKDDYDKAIADFTQAIRLNPNFADIYSDRGDAYYDKGDYDRAIADYTQALKLNNNSAAFYNNRGNAYNKKGDYNRAIEDYNQVLRLKPDGAFAYDNRGHAYFNKGDYDKAIADFTQAIRLDPNDANFYYNRGTVYNEKDDYDKAIADFTQAIRLDPDYIEAYINRGVSYFNKGDPDRAIADFEAALKIDPNDADARYDLDFARRQRGR